MPFTVTICKTAPAVQFFQCSVVLPGDPPVLRSFFVFIQIFSVNGSHSRHVLYIFHAALDFQRIHACPDEFRQQRDGAQILRTQHMSPASGRKHLPSASSEHPVRQTARLSAASPVSASPSVHAAKQALPRITVTERPVNENLYFQSRILFDLTDLIEGQLSGGNHPVHVKSRGGPGAVHIRDGHLGASVDLHAGKILPDQGGRSHILHDHPVKTFLIKRQ